MLLLLVLPKKIRRNGFKSTVNFIMANLIEINPLIKISSTIKKSKIDFKCGGINTPNFRGIKLIVFQHIIFLKK